MTRPGHDAVALERINTDAFERGVDSCEPMPHPPITFQIPRVFHMAHAPLGRLLRARTADRRLAESRFILIVVFVVLGLMLVNQFAWAFVRAEAVANPQGPEAIGFWLSQIALGLVFLVTCVIGFKPRFTATLTDSGLELRDKRHLHEVPYAEIESVDVVSALDFHRHYRRYRQTRVFVNRLGNEVVLIRTTNGPVVVGMPESDRQAFKSQLEERLWSSRFSNATRIPRPARVF